MSIVAVILVVAGSIFAFLSALGLLRFPDLYTRLHATAKTGPLGAGLVLLGVGVGSADLFVMIKCVVGLVFLILVGPVSAHLLARAALRTNAPPASITSIDERPPGGIRGHD